MSENPLASLADYSRFVAELLNRATVTRSTVIVWSDSPFTGVAEGEVWFSHGIRLRMREEVDFDAALIAAYGYEVYRGGEKVCWYGEWEHPEIPALASTFPHHKHVPPNLRDNRVPAPGIRFDAANLDVVLQDVRRDWLQPL